MVIAKCQPNASAMGLNNQADGQPCCRIQHQLHGQICHRDVHCSLEYALVNSGGIHAHAGDEYPENVHAGV